MQRFTLVALLIMGLLFRGHAQQIPNGNLETWTTSAGINHAQNWLTTDDLLTAQLGVPFATGTTSKTTDAHSGSFAAKLETVSGVPGFLILGTSVTLRPDDILGGLPFTGRPASMQLHYKLSGTNLANDQPIAGAALTRTTNGQRQTIAEGALYLPAAATYTPLTIPLRYSSTLAPDSIHIFIASGIANTLTSGTTLYVDDIALGTALPTRETLDDARLTLFPNPSADGRFTLDAPAAPALLSAPLTVSDLTGRVVLAQPALEGNATRREIDLRGQPVGIYLLRLTSAAGPVVRRLHIR